jgi:hypothetical protein
MSDASKVVISASSGAFNNIGLIPSSVTLQGMTITVASGTCITNSGLGTINFANVIFGSCTQYHISCGASGAKIVATGNYQISGGAQRHIHVQGGGYFQPNNRTVTFLASVAFSSAFALAFTPSTIIANGMTFAFGGFTVTGTRYNANTNGVIYVGGGGAAYFPGDAAGSAQSGGVYT